MKDIYIQFRGKYKIDGESRDSEHKGWLEVNTWDHLIRQPKSATASSVGGHTSERCEHADMTFIKDLDSTSLNYGKLVLLVILLMKFKLIFIVRMAISVLNILR